MTFDNRTAVITGAAGRIGRETAKLFARYGVKLFLADINMERLEPVAEELRKEYNADVKTVFMDVSDPESIKQAADYVFSNSEKVDILVNDAGRWPKADFLECSDEEWLTVMKLNLDSVFRISRIFVDKMLEQNYGRIINLGSIAGEVGLPRHCAYSVAKAGVIMLTKNMAMTLATRGITVNSISPGMINDRQAPNKGTWLGRCGTGDEVANAIVFLAADESGYITGVDMPVDGGRILGPLNV